MEPRTELQQIAIDEARKKELATYQRAEDLKWLDGHMEGGRMGRCLAQIQQEAEMEREFRERTDHAAIVNARAEREIALGAEIYRRRREKECQLLRRHLVRQNDHSLKELAKNLQAGYSCRDLSRQIMLNEYKRQQEKAAAKAANDLIMSALYNDDEEKERQEREKMEKNMSLGNELRQQLVNKQLQKQCQYEDTLIEKKMLEEVMRTIADEDHRELEQKRRLKEKTYKEMITFKKAQDAWKAKQKAMVLKEEKEIERQKNMMADRTKNVFLEKQRLQQIKDDINERMCAKKMAAEAAIQERADQITLLQQQEYLEKCIQDEIDEKEKIERSKREVKEALTAQMEARKKLAEDAKKTDLEYRRKNEALYKEDLEKEREKAQKKRREGRAYSQLLLKQIEENAARRKQVAAEDEARAVYVRDFDKQWIADVKEERRRMISEHVPQILGYLQAGVVRKEDLPAVREGANKREDLAKLEIEKMGESNRPNKFPKCNAQCLILKQY